MIDVKPSFSIVIPTKDRPLYVQFALQSLLQQTCGDFECILVNNSDLEAPTKEAFYDLVGNDVRFKYIRPPKSLAMHENWQHGLQFCTGTYISLLLDKIMLFPKCLEICSAKLAGEKFEIINWWSDTYNFVDEFNSLAGEFVPFWEFNWAQTYNANQELKRRLRFLVSRRDNGRLYFRGKICFGFFHKDLIAKITRHLGSVFPQFCPDYTSTVAGLCLAENVHDIGMPLCLSINSKLSHGQQCDKDNGKINHFIQESDANLSCAQGLPFPNITSSLHNLIAYDYINVISKLKGVKFVQRGFNIKYLSLRVQEDLAIKGLDDSKLKVCKKTVILNKLSKFSSKYHIERILRKLKLLSVKYTPFPNKTKQELEHRKFCLEKHSCQSPLEGVKMAHNYYAQYTSLPYFSAPEV